MVIILLKTVHIIICLLLVAVVILQQSKNADMASSFGGAGATTAYGATGGANVLTRITTTLAAGFMITSLSLGLLMSGGSSTIMFDQPTDPNATTQQAPVEDVQVPQENQQPGMQEPVQLDDAPQRPNIDPQPAPQSAPEAAEESAPAPEAAPEAAPEPAAGGTDAGQGEAAPEADDTQSGE